MSRLKTFTKSYCDGGGGKKKKNCRLERLLSFSLLDYTFCLFHLDGANSTPRTPI